ncbi:MAG: TolC family protein [Bryobacteraceae bacterium]|nr:TolC family protein [Bryobacteraceae bacterium]MDW8379317.1 TolC family protein [Bryobacterales bacterium]
MRLLLAVFLPGLACAELRSVTLKEAIELALRQSPELFMARLEEQKAQLAIREARDPFRPKVYAGSGLAYTSGFPMSIEGSAPSVFQARGVSAIYNKAQNYNVARTVEQSRAVAIDTQIRREQVIYQTVLSYLEAARWARLASNVRQQIEGMQRAVEVVRLRVQQGRELELTARQLELSLAKAKQRLLVMEQEQDQSEAFLANLLGFGPDDRIRPATDAPLGLAAPESESQAISSALEQSRELKRLQSAILAKELESKQHLATRLPTFDLVAQYGLFARFNNYEDFFRRFQRHNGQLGVSVQVPLFLSAAARAGADQAQIDVSKLKTEMLQTRNRIALETRRSHQQWKRNEQAREVARLELDLARERVNVTLAKFEEGRATLEELEQARFQEQEKWIDFYEAQFAVERAKLDLLRHTGDLLAGLP